LMGEYGGSGQTMCVVIFPVKNGAEGCVVLMVYWIVRYWIGRTSWCRDSSMGDEKWVLKHQDVAGWRGGGGEFDDINFYISREVVSMGGVRVVVEIA
jgi:hypothetical protein